MTQSLARRVSLRLSIVVAAVFGLLLAAVPAQAVESLAKPRYRSRSGSGATLPLWLIIVIIVGVILVGVLAKMRSSAKSN